MLIKAPVVDAPVALVAPVALARMLIADRTRSPGLVVVVMA